MSQVPFAISPDQPYFHNLCYSVNCVILSYLHFAVQNSIVSTAKSLSWAFFIRIHGFSFKFLSVTCIRSLDLYLSGVVLCDNSVEEDDDFRTDSRKFNRNSIQV